MSGLLILIEETQTVDLLEQRANPRGGLGLLGSRGTRLFLQFLDLSLPTLSLAQCQIALSTRISNLRFQEFALRTVSAQDLRQLRDKLAMALVSSFL